MSKTKEISMAVGKMQVLKFHSPVIEIISPGMSELDVMSISKSGVMYGFEIKISRSDFLREKSKEKYKSIPRPENTPNYFSFVCPKDLIKPHEIDNSYGLYYYQEGVIHEITSPQKQHNHKHDLGRIMERVCRIYSERHFLGSSRMTYENKLIYNRDTQSREELT